MPWEYIFLPAVIALIMGFKNGLKYYDKEVEEFMKEDKNPKRFPRS